MGWAGKGKIPQPAQPQSTAAVRGSSGAAHLPVSPPVRSPARWGSMAGSPLLHGPRAGGVGLLVLLLLGLLGPHRTLCARPVKVRPGSGTGGGVGECLAAGPLSSLAPVLGTCGEIGHGGLGSSLQSAPRPCQPPSLGCAGGSIWGSSGRRALPALGAGPGLAPPAVCGAVHGRSTLEGEGCGPQSVSERCDDRDMSACCLCVFLLM